MIEHRNVICSYRKPPGTSPLQKRLTVLAGSICSKTIVWRSVELCPGSPPRGSGCQKATLVGSAEYGERGIAVFFAGASCPAVGTTSSRFSDRATDFAVTTPRFSPGGPAASASRTEKGGGGGIVFNRSPPPAAIGFGVKRRRGTDEPGRACRPHAGKSGELRRFIFCCANQTGLK